MKTIDLEKWKRKEHFEFFSKYDDPFFGVVTEIDCTKVFDSAKKSGNSFFSIYLHKSIVAVNRVEELKYRVHEGKVVCFDEIHAATTIGRKDGNFGFSFIHFSPDFETFNTELLQEIETVRSSEGLRANADAKRPDAIHYSTLPWIHFTGLTHARNFKGGDSVPKITFGKVFSRYDRKFFPMSIDVHHGLADGLHVSRYIEAFQTEMNA